MPKILGGKLPGKIGRCQHKQEITLRSDFSVFKKITGANGGEDPPVPIPNTEVKLTSVENTWRVTAWEDRAVLTLLLSSVGRACGC